MKSPALSEGKNERAFAPTVAKQQSMILYNSISKLTASILRRKAAMH